MGLLCRSHFCSPGAEVGGNTIPRLLRSPKINFITALPGALAAVGSELSYIYNAPLGSGAFRKHPDHYISDYYSQKAAKQTLKGRKRRMSNVTKFKIGRYQRTQEYGAKRRAQRSVQRSEQRARNLARIPKAIASGLSMETKW